MHANAGKFLTVATDGESLTMVDEPSGVPDWVTFITAVRNQMLLKAGGDGTGTTEAWLKFTSYDGATTAQINFNGIDGSLYINGSQSQINLTSQISFIIGGTPRLTITSGGDVGIGITPTSKLTLLGTSTAASNTPSDAIVDIKGTSTAHLLMGVANVFPYGAWINTDNTTQPLVLMGTGGNVGIGTDDPQDKLEIKSGYLRMFDPSSNANAGYPIRWASNNGGTNVTYANITGITTNSGNRTGDLVFSTSSGGAPTEKMRISSGGLVLIDNASSFTLATHTPDVITKKQFGINTGSNTTSYGYDRIHFDTGNFFVLNQTSTGVKLTNGATAWAAQSDERLKENIAPLENVLNKIKNYRCVEYNLKTEKKDKKIGFIAQDWKDDFLPIVDEDLDGFLSMKYTETIPVLLKAIQEQQTIIEDLKARIETLEG